METTRAWQRVLRLGVLPRCPVSTLALLREALKADSPELIQGITTEPPPPAGAEDWPCEGACLLGWIGWRGKGLRTAGEVESYFAEAVDEIDAALGEYAAVRWLTVFWDESPRGQVFREVLREVEAALAQRTRTNEVAT